MTHYLGLYPVFQTSGSAIAEGPRDVLVSRNSAIVWHYLRDHTFSRFYTIPKCERHTHTDGRTDTRRRHVLRLA